MRIDKRLSIEYRAFKRSVRKFVWRVAEKAKPYWPVAQRFISTVATKAKGCWPVVQRLVSIIVAKAKAYWPVVHRVIETGATKVKDNWPVVLNFIETTVVPAFVAGWQRLRRLQLKQAAWRAGNKAKACWRVVQRLIAAAFAKAKPVVQKFIETWATRVKDNWPVVLNYIETTVVPAVVAAWQRLRRLSPRQAAWFGGRKAKDHRPAVQTVAPTAAKALPVARRRTEATSPKDKDRWPVVLNYIETTAVPAVAAVWKRLPRPNAKQAAWAGGNVVALAIIFLVANGRHKGPATNSVAFSKTTPASPASPGKLAVQTLPRAPATATLLIPVFAPTPGTNAQPRQADNSQTVDISTSRDDPQREEDSADQSQVQNQPPAKQTPVEQPKPVPSTQNNPANDDVPPPPESNGDPASENGSTSGGP